MDGGDSCTTMGMYLIPMLWHLNVIKVVSFMCILSQLKIINNVEVLILK